MAITYDHKQKSPLYLILAGFTLVYLAVVVAVYQFTDPADRHEGDREGLRLYLSFGVGGFMLLLSASLVWQRVTIDGDELRVVWGPLPLFTLLCCNLCGKGRIDLSTVKSVEVERPACLWGFGLRFTPMGIMLRLWGLEVAHLHIDGAADLLIGSDEADALRYAVQQRIQVHGRGGLLA
mmetsp:Transcript_44233/g.105881  ORF Transcript_44233/g.105881 Transcript_44233/m.105881 type:complete len:179 (-) Transcript_44233:29-565(-)